MFAILIVYGQVLITFLLANKKGQYDCPFFVLHYE